MKLGIVMILSMATLIPWLYLEVRRQNKENREPTGRVNK